MRKPLSEVWGLPSIVEQFHDAVVNYPDNIALICTHQDADLYDISGPCPHGQTNNAESTPYLRWTFKDLKQGVDRLMAGLESLGVKKGTAIITLLPNCAEFVLTCWAAMELGAVMAPLDPRRLSNSSEVSYMLETIIAATNNEPPVIVTLKAEYLNTPATEPVLLRAAVVVDTTGVSQSYVPFKDIMALPQRSDDDTNGEFEYKYIAPTDGACVIFTSGSTSLPKGVLRSRERQASLARDVFQTPGYRTLPGDLWCSVTPNNHSVGSIGAISPMLVGAGIVFPGEAFSAAATAQTLVREQCTHILLVPGIVSLIAEYLTEDTGKMRTSLKAVMLVGSPPTTNNIHTCFDALGTRGVCIRYGSTEGVACVSDITANAQELIGNGGRLTVGRPMAGDGVKICQPNETGQLGVPLPRGTTGEIHYSAAWGAQTMYIGTEDTKDTCYIDEQGKRWFITGDEGIMDEQGRLYVVGRLKDMIIRGGENISPAAIETRLANNPRLASKSVQIVGQPDPISGEVPVAIIASGPDFHETVTEIYRTIRDDMGLMWAPHDVIHLEQLGLGDWPRTSAGKIHRVTLRKLVQERYQNRLTEEAAREAASQSDLAWNERRLRDEILRTWARSVGLEEDQLPLDVSISQYADSLSVARVRGHLRRMVPGLKKLSSGGEEETVRKVKRKLRLKAPRVRMTWQVPPSPSLAVAFCTEANLKSQVHTIARPDLFDSTKKLVTEAISQHGFQWDDVASVIPAQNFIDELSREGVLDSAKFQNAFVTKTESSVDHNKLQRVKLALKAMLRANSLLPSFLVWNKETPREAEDNIALHVTLKPSETLYEHVLQDGGSVDTVEDLNKLASAHPHPEWTLYPGILFRVLLFKVKTTNTVGFIVSVSHGVMDATYTGKLLSDIDQALNGPVPQQLLPHTSYRLWAESYYSFRESPQARASVQWHTNYLDGIHNHIDKAQWPQVHKRGPFDPTGSGYGSGAQHSFVVPDLAALRKKHPQISAPVIVKAALALLHVYQTGYDHAVFSNVQAGRTAWPFMPTMFASNHGLFDEATDVAGPLLQSVTNLIKISPDESVLDMLKRLQADQQALTQHAHAPWPAIERALDKANGSGYATGSASSHRGLMRRVFTSQVFNWVPGMGAQGSGLKEPFANLRKLRSVTRWQVGLIVRAGLGGPDGDTVFLNLLGDGLTDVQMEETTKKLEALLRSLTRPESWHAPVMQCMI
ncbi:AMP-dependent synthetase/ligase [Penicillium cf. griseofulvum]|uniref:AMP-dependent synthetase/ligase n=1 Tax=Penicillium cf. griseofulvum TaxID=2972120 RepID=A0A9W9JMX1_9EURO|nr:AMP-dependent synthetase/ligase [Penicillium cf. griseofulvum]KAJ5451286.1 AMP-dependent synthetase/ligase [Penicillium cf. griseofulvum]